MAVHSMNTIALGGGAAMLKTIADISPEFSNLIDRLDLPFSKPQLRRIAQVAESLIVTEGRKTPSELYRHIVGDPCPKAAAFSFRQSPWQAEILRAHLRAFLVQSALELAEKQQAEPVVYMSLDDSLTARHPGSTRLQAVDWHFDHSAAFSGGQP